MIAPFLKTLKCGYAPSFLEQAPGRKPTLQSGDSCAQTLSPQPRPGYKLVQICLILPETSALRRSDCQACSHLPASVMKPVCRAPA